MKQLNKLLKELYPEQASEVIASVSNSFDGRRFKSEDRHWYNKLQLYVTYPDSFHEDGDGNLRTLGKQLKHIKKLGCNCVHILPFLASPMVDMGFDVSDYFLVREELGGGKALDQFLRKAQEEDVRVMMDVVLNHVSEEHRWFRQAVSGDEFYRDFFIWREAKPDFIKQFTDDQAVWGKYMFEGKEVDLRIIFPEQCGDIPHWTRDEDGIWYYHTFYPHQLDLNWHNHHVFVAFAKVLVYWAKKGMSFRLDAIPFVSKQIDQGIVESHPRVHSLIQALNLVVKEVNEESVFLVEANQPISKVKKYFGTSDEIQSELAYNFPLMNALWASLLTENPDNLWEILSEEADLPAHADWITFLRNHDELTLEYASFEQREIILKKLSGRGKEFREGFGISGRTASFFRGNHKRILQAYFLLASLPGNPAIIFGDEYGLINNEAFMREQTRWKRHRFDDPEIADDTRDINRSPIRVGVHPNSPEARNLCDAMAEIFKTRRAHNDALNESLWRPDSNPEVFAIAYGKDKPLHCYVNLTEKTHQLPVKGSLVSSCNQAKIKAGKLTLEAYAGAWVI